MTIKVPYLSQETIEHDAEALLAEYAHARRATLEPPIPIEDIVEKHLKLRIDFDDLHKVLRVPQVGPEPEIFGAIWVNKREICIHESLDPEEHPEIEGRYRFTLAHEGGGHWRLHRAYLITDPTQASMFDEPSRPAVICRSSQGKEPVEWQADFYASCLLMPRLMMLHAWRERFGNDNPRVLRRKNRLAVAEVEDSDVRAALETIERGHDDRALQEFVRPFAGRFQVSPIAMRIRLEKLGLLQREVPPQKSLAVGS